MLNKQQTQEHFIQQYRMLFSVNAEFYSLGKWIVPSGLGTTQLLVPSDPNRVLLAVFNDATGSLIPEFALSEYPLPTLPFIAEFGMKVLTVENYGVVVTQNWYCTTGSGAFVALTMNLNK